MNTKYRFRSVFQSIQERMRSDSRCFCTWPHKLHCSDKDRWSRESVLRINVNKDDYVRLSHSVISANLDLL